MIQPQSDRELAMQIGTSTFRFEIPGLLSETEPVFVHGITCILPEGDSVVFTASITDDPLNIFLNVASDGFDWFWLSVEKNIAWEAVEVMISTSLFFM